MTLAGEVGDTGSPDLLRVLLVEDDPLDAAVVERQFADVRRRGFEVVWVKSCKEAEIQLRGGRFELAVLDLNVADSRGLETLRRLHQAACDTPIVILSGLAEASLRDELLAEGAHEVLSKDDAGSRLFGLTVLYVIERNRAEESRRQLEKLLAASPDAVIVIDAPGRVKYVNDAALELFGREREDLANERLMFGAEEGKPVELRIPHKGEVRVGEMRVVHFDWRGEHSMLASIRDVTEQKKMELQLLLSDRMVSLGTLAAGMAHEINNPLASVVANLDLAVQDAAEVVQAWGGPTDLLDALGDAREGANRVRQIVRDLRVFSRPEEERLGPVDVRRVIESTLRMARNEIRHRARVEIEHADVPAVVADESRLGQVILNLLVNAAQAISDGDQAANSIRVSTRVGADGRVEVEVSDTGEGIPYAVQKRLFTPFFTTKPVGTGTGLGLVICQRIITAFGGEIGFQSVPGEGTRFTIRLRAAGNDVLVSEPDAALPTSAREVPRGRILVIDDDKLVRQVMLRSLGRHHEVEVFDGATEGLERLAARPDFDIIFCDLMMPETSGMQVFETLTERGLADRIIFMTGGAFTPSARAFLDEVPNHRVEKPFDLQGLRALVADVLRGRRSGSEQRGRRPS